MKTAEIFNLAEGDVIVGKFGRKSDQADLAASSIKTPVRVLKPGEKLPDGAKPISMLQVDGTPEIIALHDAGIKLTEKPDYWESFEGNGYAASRNIHEVKLKRVEKTLGRKLKVFTSKDIYGFDLKEYNKGPLTSYKNKPDENMFIITFSDGTRYLCDTTGASSYTRFWQKVI